MRRRTVLVNSLSKTYSVTGWRVGWVLAAADLTDSIRKVHDFLTVNAASPLQHAGVVALELPAAYYQQLGDMYRKKRDQLVGILRESGFRVTPPQGAYYVMANIEQLTSESDVNFALRLVGQVGVAAVPGSSFFSREKDGVTLIRFCFCKKYETLDLARQHLRNLRKVQGNENAAELPPARAGGSSGR